jgi:ABC-2 type transport system permease protein
VSIGSLPAPVTAGLPAPVAPNRAVTRLAIRQIRRSGLIVAALITGMTALVTSTYAQVMANPAATGSLEALAANPAIRTLFGEPVGLDTAGGFTVWRVGTVTAVLLGAWAILATTRITRGEEDSGRWDILLAGRVRLREAVLRHLAAVMSVPAATGCLLAGVLILSGTPASGAVIHGVGIGLLGMVFVAAAALTAQIFPGRSPATGAAVALLGVTVLLRMIGDGVTAVGWVRWLSPFGLLGLSEPYVHNRVLPLVVLLAATAVITVAALAAADRRDIRGGLLPAAGGRRPRLGLLGSTESFAVRRVLRPLAGWAIGIGAYYLLIGLTAVSVTGFLTDNPAMADQASAAGFDALGDIAGFAAVLFAILAVPVGGFTAVRMSAFVTAETDRRLTLLAAQPISRTRLLGAELTATATAATALVTLAGLATWLGVTMIGGDFGVAAALRGVWNTLPVVGLSLGAAVFAVGWAPRWVGVVGALPATGGFLLLVIAESITAPVWVRNLSPFAHLAAVPLVAVDWTATAVMTGLAAILTVGGIAGYSRRDLRS